MFNVLCDKLHGMGKMPMASYIAWGEAMQELQYTAHADSLSSGAWIAIILLIVALFGFVIFFSFVAW
jgi:hypothetical protein